MIEQKKSVIVASVTEIHERVKESATVLFTFHQKHDGPAMIIKVCLFCLV
ncbi:hypothetical protein [Zooshikella harenae]|uniref:Uncharacterized protein n=1 Tax=Zooshikella harenae TaxID=2827238 RepID=A0ABS5ZI89_9GAMM|nr:hypothetical protein [Zooshikella harenae]MBU2713680.1 hypothetical protein [Zooshikella harenae]